MEKSGKALKKNSIIALRLGVVLSSRGNAPSTQAACCRLRVKAMAPLTACRHPKLPVTQLSGPRA